MGKKISLMLIVFVIAITIKNDIVYAADVTIYNASEDLVNEESIVMFSNSGKLKPIHHRVIAEINCKMNYREPYYWKGYYFGDADRKMCFYKVDLGGGLTGVKVYCQTKNLPNLAYAWGGFYDGGKNANGSPHGLTNGGMAYDSSDVRYDLTIFDKQNDVSIYEKYELKLPVFTSLANAKAYIDNDVVSGLVSLPYGWEQKSDGSIGIKEQKVEYVNTIETPKQLGVKPIVTKDDYQTWRLTWQVPDREYIGMAVLTYYLPSNNLLNEFKTYRLSHSSAETWEYYNEIRHLKYQDNFVEVTVPMRLCMATGYPLMNGKADITISSWLDLVYEKYYTQEKYEEFKSIIVSMGYVDKFQFQYVDMVDDWTKYYGGTALYYTNTYKIDGSLWLSDAFQIDIDKDLEDTTQDEVVKKAQEKITEQIQKDKEELQKTKEELENIKQTDFWGMVKGLGSGLDASQGVLTKIGTAYGTIFGFLPYELRQMFNFTLIALLFIAIYKGVRG